MEIEGHEHQWVPLAGFYGRYQCSICEAIGYKAVVRPDHSLSGVRKSVMMVYGCYRRTCKNKAIMLIKGKLERKGVCRDHKL